MAGTYTTLVGTYRLVHRDNNDNTLSEIVEKHSSEFGYLVTATAAPTDPQQMPKIKKALSPIIQEDDKLVMMCKPDTTLTNLGTTARTQTVRIPVTIKNLRSGVVYEKTLIESDFTDRKAPVAGDKYTAGVWYDLLSLTLGAQLQMKLGHAIQDVRVDSAAMIFMRVETS